jgi:hypothetical protein
VPGLAYGPWETRTITVNGFGNQLPWNAGIEMDWTSGFRIGGTGSQIWHDSAERIATWNARITPGSADHQSSIGNVVGTAGDGAAYRATSTQGSLVGLTARTATDRVFFGTYLDSFSMQAFMSRIGIGIGNPWLQTLYGSRPFFPTQTLPLTIAEWDALFGPAPDSAYREFDLTATNLTLHVTWAVANGSPGGVMPIVRRHADTGSAGDGVTFGTDARGWLSADLVAGLPVTDTIADGTTMNLPTEWIRWIEDSAVQPIPPTITEFQLNSPYNRLDTAMVERPNDLNWNWSSHLTIPQWFVGYDPGYDGDPPYVDGTSQQGGPGVDHLASVAMSMSATITVRQRFVRYLTTTPLLHQKQRAGGVLDAHAAFARAKGTRQSSSLARGML